MACSAKQRLSSFVTLCVVENIIVYTEQCTQSRFYELGIKMSLYVISGTLKIEDSPQSLKFGSYLAFNWSKSNAILLYLEYNLGTFSFRGSWDQMRFNRLETLSSGKGEVP